MSKKFALTLALGAVMAGIATISSGAEERRSANGVAIPENSGVLTFKVWCYAAGYQALSGQPGVLDVVMTVRNQPFGEWDVVYYDPAKTNPEVLLKRLRENGCEHATRHSAKVVEKSGTNVIVENPLIAPGDLVQISIKTTGSKTGTVSVSAPSGWSVIGGTKHELKSGAGRIEIQSSKLGAPGAKELTLFVNVDGRETAFNVEVEVVHLVK